MTELEAIRRYWNTRAEGYSLKTAYDLQHAEKVWLERLRPFVPVSYTHLTLPTTERV